MFHWKQRLMGIKEEITNSFNVKLQELKDGINKELESYEERFTQMEDRIKELETSSVSEGPKKAALEDVDRCIIISGMTYEDDEDLAEKCTQLIEDPSVNVVECKRLRQRNKKKPPLVKVALGSLEEKIKVLRAKTDIIKKKDFGSLWIRSSKPHVERLIDLNNRALLELLPDGKKYKITGSGRIVKRDEENSASNRVQSDDYMAGDGDGETYMGVDTFEDWPSLPPHRGGRGRQSFRGRRGTPSHGRGMGTNRGRQAVLTQDR